jgi:hypothetical protein
MKKQYSDGLSSRRCALALLLALGVALGVPAFPAGARDVTLPVPGDPDAFFDWTDPDTGDTFSVMKGASGNTLVIDGHVNDSPFGGYAENGTASGNKVIVRNGGSIDNSNGTSGALAEGGTAENNSVTVESGGLVDGYVDGASVINGTARNNKVIVQGGRVNGDINGANVTGSGLAEGNSVTLIDATLDEEVTGGVVENDYGPSSGDATGNSVTISGNSSVGDDVVGGYSQGGNATGNSVTISGGTVGEDVIGGEAGNGNATGNTVTISGVTVGESVEGGYTESGDAKNNTVTISGGTVREYVTGGSSDSGNVENNTVTISNSTVGESVEGGWTESGNARNNTVTVSNSTVREGIGGGESESGNVENNTVTVSNSTVGDGVAGGWTGSGNATGNRVEVSGSNVTGLIFGGLSHNGNASGNSVTVSGGSFTGSAVPVSGGSVPGGIYGGYSANGNADGNTVSIYGGSVNGNVYGGMAHSAANTGATASGNTVIIGGNAAVHGSVYGGYVNSSIYDRAENNRIIFYGAPDASDAAVFGGYVAAAAPQFAGNTLVTATDGTLRLKTVDNVENFEFVLPANRGQNYVALSAETFDFGDGAGNQSKVTSSAMRGGGDVPRQGDTLTLFEQTGGTPLDTNNLLTGVNVIRGRTGMSLLYEYDALFDPVSNSVRARVSNVRVNPQTKALSEGQAAGFAFLTQGSDLIANEGMKAAVSGANAANGLSAFAATSGGWSRYDTGSHVDVSGVSVITGLAMGADINPGRLTLGAFFEGGWGNYNSYNSFSNAASVDGDGDTSYLGGGILGRFESAPVGPGKVHVETSGRMGNSATDFSSSDLHDGFGRHANYSTDGTYYGLHAGLGYIWQVADTVSLDLSGNYFWTHREGDRESIAGDPVKFDDMNSHRLRAGGRLSLAATEHIAPYVGAAYEHELDGEAEAKVYGSRISSPDLSGPTGIGEIGVTLIGGDKTPLSLDLGVQGYGGVRRGVLGSLQMKLEF